MCGDLNLKYELLMQHLKFENFDTSGNIHLMKQLIECNIDTHGKIYIKTLLSALTSTNTIPPVGYTDNVKLRIILNPHIEAQSIIHTWI
jgi:hypothetical protein